MEDEKMQMRDQLDEHGQPTGQVFIGSFGPIPRQAARRLWAALFGSGDPVADRLLGLIKLLIFLAFSKACAEIFSEIDKKIHEAASRARAAQAEARLAEQQPEPAAAPPKSPSPC